MMIANTLTAALQLTFLSLVLSACGPIPQDGIPGGGTGPTDGGLVELDENTDPRLVHSGAMGIIGTLRTDGENVFLNGERVTGPARVPNNAHLRTGTRSGARVDFRGDGYGCRIGVVDLHMGNLYGETVGCQHQVETPQGAGRSGLERTVYSVRMLGQRTELTVFTGSAEAWIWRDPQHRVPVRAYQEVILSATGIIGPRPVSGLEARQRIAWRSRFDFSGASRKQGYCERYARTAVEQNQQNLERRCGFTGIRWQSDLRRHFEWCMAGDNARVAPRETEARERQLSQCGRGAGADQRGEAFCRRYAQTAAEENQQNLEHRCGFTGIRWQSNFSNHFEWCMSGNNWRLYAGREQEARAAELKGCRAESRHSVQATAR